MVVNRNYDDMRGCTWERDPKRWMPIGLGVSQREASENSERCVDIVDSSTRVDVLIMDLLLARLVDTLDFAGLRIHLEQAKSRFRWDWMMMARAIGGHLG